MTLGNKAKDKITGFEGVLTGFSTYITGCDQYLVQPELKDGAFVEPRWIDAGRLDEIGEAVKVEDVQGVNNGCDIAAPIK